MKNLILFLALSLFVLSCKKSPQKAPVANTTSVNNRSCIVYSNVNDPRLATINTSTSKITFYGTRASNGQPLSMTNYTVTSTADSTKFDIIELDSAGLYSNVILHTGTQLHYDYSLSGFIQISIVNPDSTARLIKQPFQLSTGFIENNVRKNNLTPIKNTLVNSVFNKHMSNVTGIGPPASVNVHVTKKNTANNEETDLSGADASVIVNAYGDKLHDYSILATYNPSYGLYTLPIEQSGLSYNNGEGTIQGTLDLIHKVMSIPCSILDTQNPNSLQTYEEELESQGVCAEIPGGCAIFKAVTFLCNVDEINEFLSKAEDITYQIDKSGLPLHYKGNISATASSIYGQASSPAIEFDNSSPSQTSYNLKVTFMYKNATSYVGTSSTSGLVPFADTGYPNCTYTVEYTNTILSVNFDKVNKIVSSASVQTKMTEAVVSCSHGITAPHNNVYTLNNFQVTGNTLTINFNDDPNNYPPNNVSFVGTISDNSIEGTLNLVRTSYPPCNVSIPITLTLQ